MFSILVASRAGIPVFGALSGKCNKADGKKDATDCTDWSGFPEPHGTLKIRYDPVNPFSHPVELS